MPLEHVVVPIKDFSRGLDAKSAPSAIPEGYMERALNADPKPGRQVVKRKGYEGYYGWVPVRVSSIIHSGTSIRFRIGSSDEVDLSELKSTPILVYGKLPSAGTGDFSTTDVLEFYDHFTTSGRAAVSAGSGTLEYTATETGLATYNVFVGAAQATSESKQDSEYVVPDSVTIDQGTYQVDLGYTASDSEEWYVYFLTRDVASGETHISNVAAQTSVTIDAATHSLDTYSIIVHCYDTATTSGSSLRVDPDTVTISSTGTVTITFASAFTGDIILSAASVTNSTTTALSAGTSTVYINNPDSHYVFLSAYTYDSATTSYIEVKPGAVQYDEDNDRIAIELTLAEGSELVDLYWMYADAVANLNQIVVTDNGAVSESYSYTEPQLTIWGLPHTNIYANSASAGGHVVVLDAYRRAEEERLVCGLGGNLFSTQTYAEAGTTYGMPLFYPDIRSRVVGTVYATPLFDTTGSTQTRTRGLVTDASIENYCAKVITAAYVSEGVADYTLSFTGKTGNIAIGSALETTDYLTISGLANDIHNGTFAIASIQSDSATATVIRVANASVVSADFDEADAGGWAGVFTDQFITDAASEFIPGDTLVSDTIDTDYTLTVLSVSGTTVVVSGITEQILIVGNTRVYSKRTTNAIPCRNLAGTATTTNMVRGDMYTVSGLDRKVRVSYVNSQADNTITALVGDGATATVTTTSSHYLQAGQAIIIIGCSTLAYNGVHTVLTAPSATTFTFATTSSATASTGGTLLGHTATLDESITIQDGANSATTFTAVGRWIPIEAPDATGDLPKSTYLRHFDYADYGDQSRTRSTIIADSMFFTNNNDEIYKFDGTNIYQAGLFRWQPQLFSTIDTSGSITLDPTTAAFTARSGSKYTVTYPQASAFQAGDRIKDSDSGAYYTIKAQGVVTDIDTPQDYIYTTTTISGATTSGNLTRVIPRRYYFRLNAIDDNNNIVMSAATGADDCIIELAESSNVNIRLVGMPVWGNYDYDRIELEVYCTKVENQGSGPFYRNRTVSVSFAAGYGYIDIVDATPDDLLVNWDTVTTGLVGAELGTTWDQPLRCKYLTTADGRLVGVNCTDYPQLDIVVRPTGSASTVTSANLAGKTWLFRKDNDDTVSTTDMLNRVVYEFISTSGAVTIVPASDITTTATTFTIAETGHGLAAGDWVYLYHSAVATDKDLTFAGWWQIASKTDNAFTINFSGHGKATAGGGAADVDRYICASTKQNVPVLLGTDGNYAWKNSNPSWSYEFTAMVRLASAINATMRMTDTSVTGFTTFVPWITAHAGSEYGSGQLIIRQPGIFSTTMEVEIPILTGSETFSYYINNIKRGSTAAVAAVSTYSKSFPSRAIISYPNYAELFDAPAGTPSESDSAVDINAADGQETTGAIPFFAESTFGSAQVEGMIVVFKSNSIYLLNVRTKEYQKVEQPYGGCTIPDSIAHTKDGVIFANEAGIYRLNRQLKVEQIGDNLDREWDEVAMASKTVGVGFNYLNGNQYRLSMPYGEDQTTNNYVFVYHHELEMAGQQYGAWSIYDNHSATAWTNLGEDAMFATSDGQIYKLRRVGDNTDYRDDASAIDMDIIFRAEDFNLPGTVKKFPGILIEFHNDGEAIAGTTVSTAIDMSQTFNQTDAAAITTTGYKVTRAWFSPYKQKGDRIQLRIQNSTIDAPVPIAGIAYRVAALNVKGILEAANL